MGRTTNTERNENIIREWAARPSATVDDLAHDLGFSRGVIIGVLDRAGMLNRQKTYTGAPRPKAAPQPLPEPKIVCEAVGPGVGLLKLKDSNCRWPIGRGGDGLVTFCGDMKALKSSYCEEHFNRSRGGYMLRGA